MMRSSCSTSTGADALVLAGGLDSMDWLKDRLKKPQAVVDLGAIKELKGVKELNGGLEIGAMTPLTEVVKHPMVARSSAC
jgi:xanthine dehydrogenase YagS FAD-binding subunit